jgi:hypothetical protein
MIGVVVRYKLYWEEEIFYDLLRQCSTACLRQERRRVEPEEERTAGLIKGAYE